MTTPFPSSYRTMWCSPHFGSALCPDRGPDEYPVHSVGRIARLARMTTEITRINPDQLHPTPGYHHITVVEAGRTAFLAGQCPLERSDTLVGPGDLDAQIDQVAANALAALSTVGARPDQVVRSVIYVVSGNAAILGVAWQRLTRSPSGPRSPPRAHCWASRRSAFPGS